MADVKPLRLKTQRVASKVEIAQHSPIAQVCVDTGIFHLQNQFDYLIPETISEQLVPGVLVKVPFGASQQLGYVVSRGSGEIAQSKLKTITKLVSPIPLFTEELLENIDAVCERYACKPWDLVKSAIPPRVGAVEKAFLERAPKEVAPTSFALKHRLLIVNSLFELRNEIEVLLKSLNKSEQLLVLLPDERDLAQLLSLIFTEQPLVLSSTLEKSERYENYLKARFDHPKLIFGNRSAVFTPLAPNSKILIFNDGDESMYERRHPGWNVRDVALLRSSDFSIIFAGASPSLEVARLAKLGWIETSAKRSIATKNRSKFVFSDSRESDIAVIKAGIKEGNVLVSMAETGYVNAIACQKCRNQAKCDCGGKLYIPTKSSVPICTLCESKFASWKCTWCSGDQMRAISRGSSRYVEEISKAVPGVRVLLSKGGSRIDILPKTAENLLVISSYGCEPIGQYSAVVLHSLENLTNRIELRSLENIRRILFENIGKVSVQNSASVFVDLLTANPISQGLIRNDAISLCELELEDRKSSGLPPFTRVATISGESAAIRALANQLNDNELFTGTSGLTSNATGQSKLVLRAPIDKSEQFSLFFRDLARYRSLKGLTPLSIRIDPFSI